MMQTLIRSLFTFVLALGVLFGHVTHAQRIEVPYEVVLALQYECMNGAPLGECGLIYAAPGEPGSKFFYNHGNCDLICDPEAPNPPMGGCWAPFVSVGDAGLPACLELSGNGMYYTEGDGGGSITVNVSVGKYAGSLESDACNGTLPPDGQTSALIWYEPPGTNVPGGLTFPGVEWSITRNPGGATLAHPTDLTVRLIPGTNEGTVTVRGTCTGSCGSGPCYVEIDLSITRDSCTTVCSTSPSFGEGTLTLDGLDFKVHLGRTIEGQSAGFLHLKLHEPSMLAFHPQTLKYNFKPRGIMAYPNAAYPNQIKTPQGVVRIAATSAAAYEIQCYSLNSLGDYTNGGWTMNCCPKVTWTVENPIPGSSNSVQITETRENETPIVNVYSYNGEGWSLFRPGTSENDYYDWFTNAFPVRLEYRLMMPDGVAGPEYIRQREYTLYPFGERLTYETFDDGNVINPPVETWDYTTNGLVQQHERSDGTWEYFVYDDAGRVTNLFSGFRNQGVTTNKAICRLTDYSYSTNAVSGSDDAGHFDRGRPRQTVEYLLGQEVGRSYFVSLYGESLDIRCVSTGAVWNASDNLITTNRFYTNGLFYGQLRSVERPDHTMDFFEYTLGGSTTNWTNIVWSGSPNATKTGIWDGTKTTTIRNPVGEFVRVTVESVSAGTVGLTLSREDYSAPDDFGSPVPRYFPWLRMDGILSLPATK